MKEARRFIYIYQDDGVSPQSFYQTVSTFTKFLGSKYSVMAINSQEIKQGDWAEKAVLLVMPGGADIPYLRCLKGIGNKKIKEYVDAGGAFMGICAGSYYGSGYVEFDKNGPLEVLGERELKFFQGKAIGPILAPYDYKIQTGCRAAVLSTAFEDTPEIAVYYNGGGFFENAEKFPHTEVIARYENKLPAIIKVDYGRGKVILSGVHFEFDPYTLDPKDPYIQKILQSLIQSDYSRQIFINHLIEKMNI
jgi:glutamine amidotransferase-like uncharacterized protein